MQRIIIADTSCLILLDKIDEVTILHSLFGEVHITSIIAKEFGEGLPDWIKISNPENESFETILQASVDKGEASALALALENAGSLLILDDQKARRMASVLGLKFTGTLGILVSAKTEGYLPSMRDAIRKIRKTSFHLTPDLEEKILRRAGE